jgi:60 kDa SS-A/Ro ribonucleoprotein
MSRTDSLTTIRTRNTQTPQSEPSAKATVKNSAGGHVFGIDSLAQLRRFLILGVAGGTYYTSEKELTKANAKVVLDLAVSHPREVVDIATDVSVRGLAPKQGPALFAIAAVSGLAPNAEDRAYALSKLQQVCRTGTALFQFVGYMEQFRGWGRAAKRAVADWYLNKIPDQAAYQMVKYRQRDGWSQRDLLRLAKPVPVTQKQDAMFKWAAGKSGNEATGVEIIDAFETAQKAKTLAEWLRIIDQNPALTWEMLPDKALNEAGVWAMLIEKGIPQTALMRQLPRLTRLGIFNDSEMRRIVAKQLTDPERLQKGRVHPFNVLVALKTYQSGRSLKGSSTWEPNRQVIDALDLAFYAAYKSVKPSGKRLLIALDVSGSMSSQVAGLPISCREAAGALAMTFLNTEPDCEVIGFTAGGWRANAAPTASGVRRGYYGHGWDGGVERLTLSARQRLDDVLRTIQRSDFGATDCALPMLWAKQNKLDFDGILVVTDNETWAGNVHPHEALEQYKAARGLDTRFAVLACTPTPFSIADPKDPSMLDVCGLDSSVPTLITDFFRGDL